MELSQRHRNHTRSFTQKRFNTANCFTGVETSPVFPPSRPPVGKTTRKPLAQKPGKGQPVDSLVQKYTQMAGQKLRDKKQDSMVLAQYYVLSKPHVTEPSQRPCGTSIMIVPVSEIRKMKFEGLCNMLKAMQ